jgi:hypothetical protein
MRFSGGVEMRWRLAGITIFRAGILIVAVLVIFSASGCTMAILHNYLGSGNVESDSDPVDPNSGLTQCVCDTEIVTLAWDPPPGEVAGYRVYYRVHEVGDWTLIGEVPVNDNPELELLHADFGNGDFDFGVVAIDAENQESAMHTSLDDTALPATGWYLSWAL